MKLFEKYLLHYAESAATLAAFTSIGPTQSICVIPVYDEQVSAIERFLSHSSSDHVTFVLVFNCPQGGPSDSIIRTQALARHLIREYGCQSLSDHVWQTEITDRCRCFLMDFSDEASHFSPKQGVGLARKIGLDFAIRLCWEQTKYAHEMPRWLHCCDGDVTLPSGYFDIPAPERNQSVALYPFQHAPEAGLELAMALYEFKLDYYVSQLMQAGSPYAFHTIGSIIACTPQAYVQVRGMPKRSGAEDFYFLNKLAKVGDIQRLESPSLTISGRASQRVPFGTGPAVEGIAKMSHPIEMYTYYHPECFQRLSELLCCIDQTEVLLNTEALADALTMHCTAENRQIILAVLKQLKVDVFFQHQAKQHQPLYFKQNFHTWFDAFLTLRFVHLMRDHYYPNLNIECLKSFPNLPSTDLIDSIAKGQEGRDGLH